MRESATSFYSARSSSNFISLLGSEVTGSRTKCSLIKEERLFCLRRTVSLLVTYGCETKLSWTWMAFCRLCWFLFFFLVVWCPTWGTKQETNKETHKDKMEVIIVIILRGQCTPHWMKAKNSSAGAARNYDAKQVSFRLLSRFRVFVLFCFFSFFFSV